MPDEKPSDAKELGRNFALAQVGMEMVVPLIVGLVLDHYAGTGPWLTISGIILGFVGGVFHIVMLTKQQETGRPKNNKPGSGPR
jgi:F0F1-type ATP synthase assembly protein I